MLYNMKEFNREKVVIGINSVGDFNFFVLYLNEEIFLFEECLNQVSLRKFQYLKKYFFEIKIQKKTIKYNNI